MEQPDSIRQISKRKVLYVELDEEITSVFERVERLKYPDVYLVVPNRATLFQSVVNLSILKQKVEGLGKSLSLITSDDSGIKLAHQAGIAVFDQLDSPPPVIVTLQNSDEEESGVVIPIAAAGNEVTDDRPQRLKEKKISIFDVVKTSKQRRAMGWKAFIHRVEQFRKNRELTKEPSKFALGAPSGKTLGTLVVGSLMVLLLISYIALPGATVVVTPRSNVIEQSTNVTLADASRYGTKPSLGIPGNVLAYFPIEASIEYSIEYIPTGQIFDGTHATGTVTIINERGTSWPLVAFTRLQTENGLIYRISEAITVPAARGSEFGTAEVSVVADEIDSFGRVIGERGNIGSSEFFLPGLREESQKELYARSSAPMSGGSTVVTLKITQEDLDASGKLMRSELESKATQALEDEIDNRNTLNGTSLELLKGLGAIKHDEPQITVPTYLLEALQNSFEVTGRLRVTGVAYHRGEFLRVMEEELRKRKSPDKILLRLNSEDVTYEIFKLDDLPGQIKLTATIKGIEAYNLNPESEGGARLIKKIKEHIAGKSIKDAEDYVQNLPEINKVTISSWPVWSPTIPTVFENIEIKLDEKSMRLLKDEE